MQRETKSRIWGAEVTDGSTTFSLYFSGAAGVRVEIFKNPDDTSGIEVEMIQNSEEVWELTLPEDLTGMWYHYRASWPPGEEPDTPYANCPFSDPWSKHVAVRNHYRQESKSCIISDHFDWEGDHPVLPPDPRDLIIYETHIKDLVASEMDRSRGDGVYESWLDMEQKGGIPYLKSLGVNAVEFLPLQKFSPMEPPWKKKTKEGFLNSWNPYARNHWGYMTTHFFAPETSYGPGESLEPGSLSGKHPFAPDALKRLVKALHREGIAVIMDVVYNHSSNFDINILSHHQSGLYLRKGRNGELMNRSGTGNELNTERKEVRELIVASVAWWAREYHIDGFRFDLAGLIDEKSWDHIRKAVRDVHPDTVLIAEPWGGRYVPWLFSNHGWSSWNDQFRNGIKGIRPEKPDSQLGFIFASWIHGSDRAQLENWFSGTLRNKSGGLFQKSSHSVNYLESHDGFTLGDFIRISLRYGGENSVVENREEHVQLLPEEMKVAKLAAFCLMVSQGVVMIHSGQEFARSKVIPVHDEIDDAQVGRMDHDSYNKDNGTNWIDFDDLKSNESLYHYYKGLISIRKGAPALGKSDPESIRFDRVNDPLHLLFFIDGFSANDLYDYYVAINVTSNEMKWALPAGYWELLAGEHHASELPSDLVTGERILRPGCAELFRKLRH
ncbi:MAG: alpha-amylase family glycosyl hydrolase [Balneolaceae bacterium]